MVLLEIQEICDLAALEAIDSLPTFNQVLAEIHLNKRRVFKMMRNAEYALNYLQPEEYQFFDSSVLELLRLNKKDPRKYLNDILAGVSYTDLKEIISS